MLEPWKGNMIRICHLRGRNLGGKEGGGYCRGIKDDLELEAEIEGALLCSWKDHQLFLVPRFLFWE